jgi:hypothetical protein
MPSNMKNKAFKKSGVFCQRNWNDPLCLKIRDLLIELTDYYGHRKTFDNGKVVVDPLWFCDENYFTILDRDPHHEFMWIVTWYKSRGQTDMIMFQGGVAEKHEAEMLLKLLKGAK